MSGMPGLPRGLATAACCVTFRFVDRHRSQTALEGSEPQGQRCPVRGAGPVLIDPFSRHDLAQEWFAYSQDAILHPADAVPELAVMIAAAREERTVRVIVDYGEIDHGGRQHTDAGQGDD